MLSVIIPTFNEIKNGYIQTTFNLLKNLSGAEIICVDSGSTDGTKELIIKSGFKLISVDTTSRAKRLNTGIQHAKGDMLLLHHPRSLLSVDSFAELQNNQEDLYWGAFTHKFDLNHPLLKFTSWWSNKVRGDLRHIFYLDHCLFIRKEIFEQIGLIPEVDIFEDTDLSATVGWLTALFPLYLQADAQQPIGDTLKSVKQQLRNIPHEGIGYNALRYCSDKVIADGLTHADVRFNYLGQTELALNSSLFGPAEESTGPAIGLGNQRDVLFDINAMIVDGQLRVQWQYSNALHRQETVASLANTYIHCLSELIDYCLSEQADGGHIASDFSLMDLADTEMDDLLESL